jgi:hypothetical protein
MKTSQQVVMEKHSRASSKKVKKGYTIYKDKYTPMLETHSATESDAWDRAKQIIERSNP